MALRLSPLFLWHISAKGQGAHLCWVLEIVRICLCSELASVVAFLMHQYVAISPWLFVSAHWCVSALTLASRARVCQRGVALSVHLSSLERSYSATPVAVRALCPPQCAALLPSLPSLFFLPCSLPPPLLLLTAASSAVSTGHHPTPWSMSCLSHTVWAAITPAL